MILLLHLQASMLTSRLTVKCNQVCELSICLTARYESFTIGGVCMSSIVSKLQVILRIIGYALYSICTEMDLAQLRRRRIYRKCLYNPSVSIPHITR